MTEAFDLGDTVGVPAGDHASTDFTLSAYSSAARSIVLSMNADLRQQFGRTVNSMTTVAAAAAGMQVNFKPSYTRSDASLPNGAFVAHLVSLGSSYAITTCASLNSLAQYNGLDRQLSSPVRLQYIFRLGSDDYLVVNEERGSETTGWNPRRRGVQLEETYLARP